MFAGIEVIPCNARNITQGQYKWKYCSGDTSYSLSLFLMIMSQRKLHNVTRTGLESTCLGNRMFKKENRHFIIKK